MFENVRYWRRQDAVQNFGDYLTEFFLSELFLPLPTGAAGIHIIGSVLDDMFIPEANEASPEPTTFWGCGLREPGGLSADKRASARILSVRGPRSASDLGLDQCFPQGDPALLLPALYTPTVNPHYVGRTICIPHFNDDREDGDLIAIGGADLVLRTAMPAEPRFLLEFIDAVVSADFVLSAALHGAVVAAAFGKPFAFWDNGHLDLPFKWQDFADSINVPVAFQREVAQGRRHYADAIKPGIVLPSLWPSLAAAPFPIRPEALLKVLRHELRAESSGAAAEKIDAKIALLEQTRPHVEQIISSANARMQALESEAARSEKENGQLQQKLSAMKVTLEEQALNAEHRLTQLRGEFADKQASLEMRAATVEDELLRVRDEFTNTVAALETRAATAEIAIADMRQLRDALTSAGHQIHDLERKMRSSRWLLRSTASRILRGPVDVSLRVRRSWLKRHGVSAASTVQSTRNGFDIRQLRNPRFRKYITSLLVLRLEPVLPRSYARRMRNRMEKHAHLLHQQPACVVNLADVRTEVRTEREHDLNSFINFEYGNEPVKIVSDLIDGHFIGNASTRWAPRQLTPELLKEWSDELKLLFEKIDPDKKPVVSIVIPVHNQIVFTLLCIKSVLLHQSKYEFEIIIGDDRSTDETREILKGYNAGIKYIQHAKNEGFLGNCNLSAAVATGEFLVLLNNDTVVLPGWLDALIDTFQEHENIGLVGSRLVYPDGQLQEAGGIVFADGSGHNFGRNGNPSEPRYAYMRDVDYVSGASIALPAHLWRRLDGFDPRYAPAYYEDTDLAFRIREEGLRVVYQPLSTVVHFEGVSHGVNVNEGTKRYQEINREKFKTRWQRVLPSQGHPTPYPTAASRNTRGRILVVDAETPFPDRDSGSIDTFNYMKILRRMGFHVSFSSEHQSWDGQYSQNLRALGVEVFFRPFWTSVEAILRAHGSSLDFVFLYRAPLAKQLLRLVRQYAPCARVVFDTVDLHFLRMEREASLNNSPRLAQKASIMKDIELEVASHSDATIVLSTYEMELLGQLLPNSAVYQIPLVREIAPLDCVPLKKRNDIVFVGGFRHTPNVDAVQWFVKEVWPLIRAKGLKANFIIIGSHVPPEIQALASSDIEVRGYVSDLAEVLSCCRLSVAPLRYGAGLKGKVVSCLSQGLPVVASSIAVEGSGLVNDVHVLVSDNPETMADHIGKLYTDAVLWERLSKAGYGFCVENFSLEAAESKLRELLGDLGNTPKRVMSNDYLDGLVP